MIARIIEFSVRNRWLVILCWMAVALWGMFAVLHTPVDAIPDLSENQVIVFADWMGRSPQDIEEQITFPLSVQLQGLAGVKAVRSSSEPNFSMINIIFDEKTDIYFARTRVLERLTTAKAGLPADVTPVLAPDATALGQIFWYTVEGDGRSADELRAVQDFTVRYQLNGLPGVAEVASVGGFVRQYQVDVNPAKLRLYNLSLSSVYSTIAASNMSVGGKSIVANNTEYLVRGIGWLKGVSDLEQLVVASRAGVPVRVKDIATVQLGPEFRRNALEKDGHEVVGGVVMMRIGENPLEVTKAIKQRIGQMQSGLPEGVRIVPFYDRTALIESAIHTVTGTLREEIIIASIAILLILTHLRSAIVVCITLPMAVLVSFLFMYYLKVPSNIMSLSGIAISIGILVDAAVVMVENATHELKEHFGDERVHGDTTEIVVKACRLVGRPIFFSVLIMLISFLPVFTFGGQEGKLSHPLAFTKSFAMFGVALLAITLVPALIPLLIRGRLRREDQNWIVRSFINIYRPVLSWVIDRPTVVWFMLSIILVTGAGFVSMPVLHSTLLAFGVVLLLLGARWLGVPGIRRWRWTLAAVVSLVVIAFLADTRFRKLGGEFMPELDEGTIMDMPLTAPRVAMGEAVDDVIVRDRLLRGFPEVEQAVGKIGRADTATDPSPVDMVETIISMKPRDWWPRRKMEFSDVLEQAVVVATEMEHHGWLRGCNLQPASWADAARAVEDSAFAQSHPKLAAASDLLNTATQVSLESFDKALRNLAVRRQVEYEASLADALVQSAYDDFVQHLRTLSTKDGQPAFLRTPDGSAAQKIREALRSHGRLLAQLPRQEEVDKLLSALREQLIASGFAASRDDLLLDAPTTLSHVAAFARQVVGSQSPTFPERVFTHIEARRSELWVARTKTLNWELYDYGKAMINDLLLDALHRTAHGTPFLAGEPDAAALNQVRDTLSEKLGHSLLLRQKLKNDIVKEMDSELQMPGWGNVWTQPIINRVNMLATGVRTQIGVKVFGPTGKSLPDAISDVQKISEKIAQRLKSVRGAVDVTADQSTGKRYVEVTINREKAARYGVSAGDISEAVETAMGGVKVTTTIEGRQRFPVQLRYARRFWQDIDVLGEVLVTGRTTAATVLDLRSKQDAPLADLSHAAQPSGGGMAAASSTRSPGGGMQRSTSAESSSPGMMQIPLRLVADIRVVEGPSMIKSENGRLRNYVTLNVRDRDVVGFVNEAQQAVKSIEAELAGTGMTIEWTGEFENQLRARQTLAIIFPMVIALIVLLLYITFNDMMDTLLVALAVAGALAGAVMFQALFKFNFSVIVSIGYVAAFGMATQTGVIMLVYLREAVDRHGSLAGITSLADLRQAVIEGAVHRLRPKLLTEGVAIIGLVPMLWATGTGAEIMRPMAAPVLGGLLISDEVIDLLIPVLFYWIRRKRWLRERESSRAATADLSLNQPGLPLGHAQNGMSA
jgi:Cu(I)/Ag(I) efflux system membrane protein CusA/SilA